MRSKNGRVTGALKLLSAFLLVAILALAAVSCGGGGSDSASGAEDSTKLPPGAAEGISTDTSSGARVAETSQADEQQDSIDESTDSDSGDQDAGDDASAATEKTVYLSGANFSVVSASREENNEIVLSSGTREVAGDYLQVEMSVTNVGDELVDLADFSFRLWNPAIDADLYEDYYGSDETYGGYVSGNIISATLLDYSTLQPVSCLLRIGETLDDAFLFFDLNPLSTAKNEGVTMAGANLIVYDTDSGDTVEINLAGYEG